MKRIQMRKNQIVVMILFTHKKTSRIPKTIESISFSAKKISVFIASTINLVENCSMKKVGAQHV